MPRSNKKKHITHQATPSSDVDIKQLLGKEKSLMISRAIASGKKHGLNMKHGSSNPGTGDCAFESIIQNINDRSCFKVKYPMTIDWYRRIWVTDMANRTIDSAFNTMTNQQWIDGWTEMLTPGIYERGIFGDLMLPGIACGVRKILLIFNTNENTPHDPIYIVDPSNFNVRPDTEIPILLSYNLAHYESMEPCTEADIQATIELVKEYQEGRYRFRRNDIPTLLSLNVESSNEGAESQHKHEFGPNKMREMGYVDDEIKAKTPIDPNMNEAHKMENSRSVKSKTNRMSLKRKVVPHQDEPRKSPNEECDKTEESNGRDYIEEYINLEEIDDFLDKTILNNRSRSRMKERSFKHVDKNSSKQNQQKTPKKPGDQIKSKKIEEENINLEEIDDFLDKEMNCASKTNNGHLYYRLMKALKDYPLTEADGKMKCPFCRIFVKNVRLHFERKPGCGNMIDMVHFIKGHEQWKIVKERERHRINAEKTRKKQKETNPELYKLKESAAFKKRRDNQKETNPELLKQNESAASKKRRDNQKETNPELLKLNESAAFKKRRDNQKETNPELLKLNERATFQKKRDKQKRNDPRRTKKEGKRSREKTKEEKRAKD